MGGGLSALRTWNCRQRGKQAQGLLTDRGVLFHSLLLEHLLTSWEQIPKKVRS